MLKNMSSSQLASEYAASQESAVFVRRAAPGLLALSGDDAAEFLQGQVTNDVEALEPGFAVYAALLTPKGKMRADMRVFRGDDSLFVLSDLATLPVIKQTIETFKIGFRFETEDLSGAVAHLTIYGPMAMVAAASLHDGVLHLTDEPDTVATIDFDGTEITALVVSPQQVDLLIAVGSLDAACERLSSGFAEASEALAEVLRVESGTPAFGRELNEDTIPGEAGLDARAVSFEKGCYVGQETVARMHYKGKPNRRLRGLTADLPLGDGEVVTASDGRELGRVGTAVVSPSRGPIALAVLRREAESGDSVTVGDASATVVEPESFLSR